MLWYNYITEVIGLSNYISVNYPDLEELHIRSIGYDNSARLTCLGPRQRDYCMLHYVMEGVGYYNNNRVAAGQGFFTPTRLYHDYHSSKDQPWQYFWINISTELAEKYAIPTINPSDEGIFRFDFHDKLMHLAKQIFRQTLPISNNEALGYFFFLMSLHESESGNLLRTPSIHVRNAKDYVMNNLSKRITVCDVADAIHINDRYLYNLFVKYEGITPKAYIDAQKISIASALLRDTELSVNDVAMSVGFEDLCIFSKFYRRGTGLSPTEYRKSHAAPPKNDDLAES